MKKTWCRRILLRMPVRSSFFCKTGPDVVVKGTPSSSAMADIAQNAGEVEFFLQDWTRCSGEGHAEFLGDDGGERGLAEARRSVQQDVIHRLASLGGGFDGDRQILFQLALSGEFGQAAGSEPHFKLQIFGLAIPRNQFPVGHVLPA